MEETDDDDVVVGGGVVVAVAVADADSSGFPSSSFFSLFGSSVGVAVAVVDATAPEVYILEKKFFDWLAIAKSG